MFKKVIYTVFTDLSSDNRLIDNETESKLTKKKVINYENNMTLRFNQARNLVPR
jgi:hypothetical protein